MNILFLVNASILAFLGVYLYSARKDRLTSTFLRANLGLAAWNVCIFLTEEHFFPEQVNLLSKVQLLSAMVFVNGFYWLCASYPVPRKFSKPVLYLNALVFAVLAFFVLFTDLITRAVIVEDQVVYMDNTIGYMSYAIYLAYLCLGSLYHLMQGYRKFPEYAQKIKYLFLGIALFVLTAIFFDMVLPLMGIYDYLIIGRLSAVFPSLFFSYVIVKHSFLDMTVIINKKVAWFITGLLVALSFVIVHVQTRSNLRLDTAAMVSLGVFWAFFAGPLQQFLLTSAKRKFVRGWYTPDEVISELSELITQEKNREFIFRTIERVLDKVFELEKSMVIVAERDESENFSYYKMLDSFRKLDADDPLIQSFMQQERPLLLEDCDAEVTRELEKLGFRTNRRSLVLPFHSPEFLEGLIVLGERSSQKPYGDADLKFFSYLVSYVSPILYRLTPMEKLEKLYFENRQRLHEAEIQLIRAQKIESIVHATRQCHHEIRTPLNIIRLGIGRIRSQQDLESYKRLANEEITRALEIVEETLTITDVTKASQDRYSYTDVNEVLNRCSRLVDQNRYQLRVDLGEVGKVWGSFSDIQVALTNLIHNALDAMPEGGMLSLSTHQAGDRVVLEVEDSGKGIPENLRSRVWEPYFSGNESEVGNSTAGRGWGLTIVNRIVTEHAGTINFSSEVGVGTRFTITLPVAEKGGREESEKAPQGKVVHFNPRKAG